MERERQKENYNRIPKDLAYLTKTELELKTELCNKIDEAQGFIDCMKNELMRVKREHFDNTERCTKTEERLSEVFKQLAEICEK